MRTEVRWYPLLWLSTWLSRRQKLAGMDGNRTHPGRLSSAPQTVLKTAFSSSNGVRRRPLQIENGPRESTDIHGRP
jgi:hypothetical protein